MTKKQRNILALAAHPNTPKTEAISAIRALHRLVENRNDESVPRSFNSLRDEVAELNAEVVLLRLKLGVGDDERVRGIKPSKHRSENAPTIAGFGLFEQSMPTAESRQHNSTQKQGAAR